MIRPNPTSAAITRPRTRSARISCVSPAPSACAVNATVLVRKKQDSQNRQSKTTDVIATPPSSVASPSRPMAIVETTPISGVVRFATIAGPAMAKTRALVILEFNGSNLKTLWFERDRIETLSPARAAEYPHQEPEWDHDHGAKQEVTPQPVDRIEAEVPDSPKQQLDAAQDIPGVETDRGQHDPDQNREQDQPERHGQWRAAQKAIQGIVAGCRHWSCLVLHGSSPAVVIHSKA